jgi:hypothetical protein
MKAIGILLVVAAAMAFGSSAEGRDAQRSQTTRMRPYYVDELWISNKIEAKGVRAPSGRRIAVDSASCLGLRRYGVRTSAYGLDKFWRFKCDVITANDRFATVGYKVMQDSRYLYWIVTSFKWDF